MNLDDVAKIHAGRRGWFRCMVCTNTASCPQLQADVWAQAWRQASTRIRQPVCTDDGLCMFFDDQHDRWCELSPRRAWRTHQLLCLPCAEAALGRELTLDDLEVALSKWLWAWWRRGRVPTSRRWRTPSGATDPRR